MSITEAKLIEIFAEVLAVDDVKATDTFLSAGGESILAMQCLSRIRAVFNVELSPSVLFSDDASIADLAQIIDREA